MRRPCTAELQRACCCVLQRAGEGAHAAPFEHGGQQTLGRISPVRSARAARRRTTSLGPQCPSVSARVLDSAAQGLSVGHVSWRGTVEIFAPKNCLIMANLDLKQL